MELPHEHLESLDVSSNRWGLELVLKSTSEPCREGDQKNLVMKVLDVAQLAYWQLGLDEGRHCFEVGLEPCFKLC